MKQHVDMMNRRVFLPLLCAFATDHTDFLQGFHFHLLNRPADCLFLTDHLNDCPLFPWLSMGIMRYSQKLKQGLLGWLKVLLQLLGKGAQVTPFTLSQVWTRLLHLRSKSCNLMSLAVFSLFLSSSPFPRYLYLSLLWAPSGFTELTDVKKRGRERTRKNERRQEKWSEYLSAISM